MQNYSARPSVMQTFGTQQYLAQLMRADVIIGIDEETGNEFLVFGRSTLNAIAASGDGMDLRMFKQPLRQATNELEAFVAAVQVAKGYQEYEETNVLELSRLLVVCSQPSTACSVYRLCVSERGSASVASCSA